MHLDNGAVHRHRLEFDAHNLLSLQMLEYPVEYVLMHALRRLGTEGTQFARAQCSTLRLKLLKIGARIKVTARRVWLSFSQAYPHAKTFTQVLANSKKEPLWNPSGWPEGSYLHEHR